MKRIVLAALVFAVFLFPATQAFAYLAPDVTFSVNGGERQSFSSSITPTIETADGYPLFTYEYDHNGDTGCGFDFITDSEVQFKIDPFIKYELNLVNFTNEKVEYNFTYFLPVQPTFFQSADKEIKVRSYLLADFVDIYNTGAVIQAIAPPEPADINNNLTNVNVPQDGDSIAEIQVVNVGYAQPDNVDPISLELTNIGQDFGVDQTDNGGPNGEIDERTGSGMTIDEEGNPTGGFVVYDESDIINWLEIDLNFSLDPFTAVNFDGFAEVEQFDIATGGNVPVGAPLLLLASGLFGLVALRERA